MRSSIGFVLVSALAACGTSGSHNNPDGSGSGGDGGNTAGLAFDITSTDITLAPGQQVTYCYYFKTPNTSAVAINKWVGDMTPGSHHMIFFAGGPSHADGIDMSGSCGFAAGNGTSQPQWTFATQEEHAEEDLPADDGTGKPLAQVIQPNTQGAFQMHYLNAGDTTLMAHVELKAYALPSTTTFTQTDAYVTYNQDLAIPPHANAMAAPPTTGSIWTATCPTPTGAKFWLTSTHAHKQAVEMDVLDGSNMVFSSTDWAHPGAMKWNATPFYTFSSNHVTWTCKYVNDGDNANMTLVAANDAAHAEMCMMTGYYFPTSGPKFNVQYNGNCLSF